MDIIGFRQCISIVVAIAILCHGFFHRFRSFLTDQPNCFAALLSMGLWNRAKGSALPTTHQVLASKILTRKLRETTWLIFPRRTVDTTSRNQKCTIPITVTHNVMLRKQTEGARIKFLSEINLMSWQKTSRLFGDYIISFCWQGVRRTVLFHANSFQDLEASFSIISWERLDLLFLSCDVQSWIHVFVRVLEKWDAQLPLGPKGCCNLANFGTIIGSWGKTQRRRRTWILHNFLFWHKTFCFLSVRSSSFRQDHPLPSKQTFSHTLFNKMSVHPNCTPAWLECAFNSFQLMFNFNSQFLTVWVKKMNVCSQEKTKRIPSHWFLFLNQK